MRTIRPEAALRCSICERTLLVGERPVRFAPTGTDFVDVCPLCQEIALEYGWTKEGSPTTPLVAPSRRRKRLSLGSLFDPRRGTAEEKVATEPILRRLTEPEQAMVEAADIFNESSYRRTVGGIAKSLGEPSASVVPLSGTKGEAVITVAWELSWYQYRVSVDSSQPVRLAERGHELEELEGSFREWNASVGPDGRLVPEIARI